MALLVTLEKFFKNKLLFSYIKLPNCTKDKLAFVVSITCLLVILK